MSKDTFKVFASTHPELAETVIKGNVTWQQLYEIFEIYGENNSIWKNYIQKNSTIPDDISSSTTTFKEFLNTFKNLDMDSIQKSVTNLQKTIGLLQGLGISTKPSTYEPRPIYRRFDD
ncbi:MAG: hypothetical protein IJI22_03800 [Bacilli bacterium]|nr:hypothetical protein [Bacilli bacterium]